jgi:hypothetical protein
VGDPLARDRRDRPQLPRVTSRPALPARPGGSHSVRSSGTWPASSQRVCLRHHRWIEPPGRTITTGQLDLRAVPEVVDAAHRHQRLCAGTGPETNDAVALAEQFVRDTARKRFIRGRIDERIDALRQERGYFPHEDFWHAVTYPGAVALAALPLSQRWTPDLLEGPHRGAFAEFDDLLHHALAR